MSWVKVEAIVIRERVETVIDAVEEATGHVGVTVVEAVGHGKERGITHEYRGRVFESRFLPKALLTFVVSDEHATAAVEAIGHGRQRGVTHEYRGRVFESRFLPKALLTFVVDDAIAADVVGAIVDSARSGNESGDGIVWTTPVADVTHNRTGRSLEAVEAR